MRTINFIKDEDKRRRIANETLEIYSPIAERMGMQEIRSELDDLCFKILEPGIRDSIIQRLNLIIKTKQILKRLLKL